MSEKEANRESADGGRLDRLERDRERARQNQAAAERSRREEAELGTSWTGVVLGLLTALGAALILSGIIGGVVAALLGGGGSSATEGGVAGVVGLLATLFLAYIVGGYAAGRISSRSGLKHGLLVPLAGLALIAMLAAIGAVAGAGLLDNLGGVALPAVPDGAPQNLSAILSVSGVLALLVPFLGGAVGGAWGAITGCRRGFERR